MKKLITLLAMCILPFSVFALPTYQDDNGNFAQVTEEKCALNEAQLNFLVNYEMVGVFYVNDWNGRVMNVIPAKQEKIKTCAVLVTAMTEKGPLPVWVGFVGNGDDYWTVPGKNMKDLPLKE